MLKPGTAWYGFRKFTSANYFSVAAALDLTFVEMPLYTHIIQDELIDPLRSADLLRLAEEAGVRMHAGVASLNLATPFDGIGDPIAEDVVEFNRLVARRIVDLSAALGLEVVRVVEPNIGDEHLEIGDQYMETTGLALRELAIYADDSGVKVVAENFGLTAKQVRVLLDAADHINVGTLFDPCNYFRIGDDPLEALELLKDRIYYCHLKDAITDEARSPDELYPGSRWRPSVAVGEGDIDWAMLLPALESVYDGVIAFECEMPEDVIAATTLSRNYVAKTLGVTS